MKQVLLFGCGLFLAAILAGLYMRPAPAPQPTSASSASGIGTSFTLYRLSGEVFYKKEGDNNFSTVKEEKIKIPNKTTVKTVNGKAYVLFEDTSVITLKENTEIIVKVEDKNVSVMQMFGKTYHRVETLLTGKTYEVRTPTTLAAVRGTKFAVSYDVAKKETKIAVTESKVAVKDVEDMMSTSTISLEEFTLVEEGNTATINSVENSRSKDRPVTLSKIENEDEMKKMVDEEVRLDEVFETLKSSDQELFKERLEEAMIREMATREEGKNEKRKDEIKRNAIPVTEDVIKKDTVSPAEQGKLKEDTSKDEVVVKKIDEETFFNNFEPLFVRLFYMDEQMSPCTFKGSPEDRVKQISSLAKESGYPLVSTTNLISFAKDIALYCSTKREDMRDVLQKRFDAEYPYQQ